MDAGSRTSSEDRYNAVDTALDYLVKAEAKLEYAQELTDDAYLELKLENEPLAQNAKTVKDATDNLAATIDNLKTELEARLRELEI